MKNKIRYRALFLIILMVLGMFTFPPFRFSNIVRAPASDFISTWRTTSASESITLPLQSTGTYNFLVTWGDGNSDTITAWNQAQRNHTYASAGYHTVTISGTCYGWYFNNGGSRTKFYDITQWGPGTFRVGNSGSYFYGCSNLVCNATDALDLTGTTILTNMFRLCPKFNGAIGNWNTASVTGMSSIFNGATAFNRSLSSWNVKNVTIMTAMFALTVFNQSIGSWNTSKVTNMQNMFDSITVFNQPIGSWDISKVTTMNNMFHGATHFNQNLNTWNVSSVTTTGFASMFDGASAFNGSVNGWVIKSTITTFNLMFRNAYAFNQPINWNTNAVTTLTCANMFQGATSFNSPITFSTAKVTSMSSMFYGATHFNQNLSSWDVTSVTTMANMFNSVTLSTANYDALLIGWGAQAVKSGVIFNGGNSKYTASTGGVARAHLIASHTWTITDGGSALVSPTVTTNIATGVGTTNATLQGYLTSDGGESCNVWFEYGYTTGYGNTTTSQSKTQGQAFSFDLTPLTEGRIYHYCAVANNSVGTSYGDDMEFLTKPLKPTDFTASMYSLNQINLTWAMGEGAKRTIIERNQSGITVWARGEGIEIYTGTGTNYEDIDLARDTIYYYQAWSYTEGSSQYSDDYASANNLTTFAEENILNISVSPGSIDFGTVNVGDSAQTSSYYFNLSNNGIACSVTINATATQNWTFVSWAQRGLDKFCMNISKDNWSSEINVANDETTELTDNLPIGGYQLFDIKAILPTGISHTSHGESFVITFTTTAI